MTTRRRLADALRILAMDAVEKARSGHPARPWDWPTRPRPCGTAF
jgi:transketolase